MAILCFEDGEALMDMVYLKQGGSPEAFDMNMLIAEEDPDMQKDTGFWLREGTRWTRWEGQRGGGGFFWRNTRWIWWCWIG